ncbi:NAD(+)/NADH kinase [Dermatobacter hominis]|uniref:NAD(+)/NADH kinase n=1 Tax=Dermatobacter hominis TaxID=2884263 RepID=UPI001D1058AB|nr:NAD(+)/NADH kinase [Dermatobacter hominis]UDY36242.1 NAD(+)/NADH kinase [Dermatobacter hominis]
MSTFGLVLHRGRAGELARSTVEWLRARDHEVRVLDEDAAVIGDPDLGVASDELCVGTDLVLSLGGDGTMLRAVDLAAPEDVPVLGVNLGQLGYLTEVEPSGVRVALKRFLAGSYTLEERMRLEAHVVDAEGERPSTALNEVVVEKSEMGHTVRLEVALDGRPFTSYVADGLILATPTGSTAYAFSVRGPIVDPRHRAVLMAPVAAHMLFDRSIVLRPDCEVVVRVGGDRAAGVSVDGRSVARLLPGASVRCRASDRPARLVTFGERDFHAVLREKFHLGPR